MQDVYERIIEGGGQRDEELESSFPCPCWSIGTLFVVCNCYIFVVDIIKSLGCIVSQLVEGGVEDVFTVLACSPYCALCIFLWYR